MEDHRWTFLVTAGACALALAFPGRTPASQEGAMSKNNAGGS